MGIQKVYRLGFRFKFRRPPYSLHRNSTTYLRQTCHACMSSDRDVGSSRWFVTMISRKLFISHDQESFAKVLKRHTAEPTQQPMQPSQDRIGVYWSDISCESAVAGFPLYGTVSTAMQYVHRDR